MTSEEYDRLAWDTLQSIQNARNETALVMTSFALVYANLSVAAAQREWNKMCEMQTGGAGIHAFR